VTPNEWNKSHRDQLNVAGAAYRERKRSDPAWQAKQRATNAAWRERNREKHRAHTAVYHAIKRGQLVRAEACQRCAKACKTEASHDDYAKPLDVEWLCRPCHVSKDNEGRER
jgi:hypothetical protein